MTALKSRGYRFDGINDAVDASSLLPRWGLNVARTAELRFRSFSRRDGMMLVAATADNGTLVATIRANDVTPGRITIRVGAASIGFGGANNVLPVDVFDGVEHSLSWVVAASGTWTIYLDGVLVATVPNAGLTGTLLPDRHVIGAWTSSGAIPFDGEIRDVRYWDRALTVAELQAFRPVLRGDEEGLAGWWPLEGDTLDRTVRPLWRGATESFDAQGPVTSIDGRPVVGWLNGGGASSLEARGGESYLAGLWAWGGVDYGSSDVDMTWILGPSGTGTRLIVKGAPGVSSVASPLQWNMGDSQIYYSGGVWATNGTPNNVAGAVGQVRRVRYADGRVQAWRDGILVVDSPVSAAMRAVLDGLTMGGVDVGVDRWSVTPLAPFARHGAAKNGARPALLKAVA